MSDLNTLWGNNGTMDCGEFCVRQKGNNTGCYNASEFQQEHNLRTLNCTSKGNKELKDKYGKNVTNYNCNCVNSKDIQLKPGNAGDTCRQFCKRYKNSKGEPMGSAGGYYIDNGKIVYVDNDTITPGQNTVCKCWNEPDNLRLASGETQIYNATNTLSNEVTDAQKMISNITENIKELQTQSDKLQTNVSMRSSEIKTAQDQIAKQMSELQNKRKLLITRNRMLQLSQDSNIYKQKVIYGLLAFIILCFVIMLVGYVSYKKL